MGLLDWATRGQKRDKTKQRRREAHPYRTAKATERLERQKSSHKEREEAEFLKRARMKTEHYNAVAKFKRAKHSARHPFGTPKIPKVSDVRRKAGKSGKLRIF